LAPPVVAIPKPSFPVVTAAILAALTCIFVAELVYGVGPWINLLEPTTLTLVAFGGLVPNLVLQFGEWYRLLSAPFLHADATHLAMNAIALFLAARSLENLVGRAWFGAIYVIGGLAGHCYHLRLRPHRSSQSALPVPSWACSPPCWSPARIILPDPFVPACS
jgi:rhomboid protease GluP